MTKPESEPTHKTSQTCCSVIEEARINAQGNAQARRSRPQPWIARKLMVGVTIALMGYATYVYVGRLCVSMIRRSSGAMGSRALGIVFLVIFSLLSLMLLWTYEKVVVTPPGFARDYVQTTDAWESASATNSSIGGPVYEHINVSPLSTNGGAPSSHPAQHGDRSTNPSHSPTTLQIPQQQRTSNGEKSPTKSTAPSPSAPSTDETLTQLSQQPHEHVNRNPQAGVLDNLPQPAAVIDLRHPETKEDPPAPGTGRRKPSTVPVLMPEYKFCSRDKILKPNRAHHCRACGTCVLKYDHHCPWIGQCVGARNHKFFLNFVLWGSIWCAWVFATLLGTVIASTSSFDFDLDPQIIIIIALSGLFGLFCAMMFGHQVDMILLNQTTVETFEFSSMKERERAVLGEMHRWYQFGAKARTRRQWDEEWGRPGKEGNLWWLESKRKNWEAVMGKSVLTWILPIGRSESDGLDYPTNPRFDSRGIWRRRAEWPKHLQ